LGIAARRQGRRLAWLLGDLRRSVRGLRQTIRYARAPDHSVGIGLLEGMAWARRGHINAYRIHVVNDSPEMRDLELVVRGEHGSRDLLEAGSNRRVPGHAAAEVFLVTDWDRLFEIVSDLPPTDPLTFLAAPSSPLSSCIVTATLNAGGVVLDELAIIQSLAE